MRGRWEPVGRIALYSVFKINFSLFSCSNRRICVSILMWKYFVSTATLNSSSVIVFISAEC